MEEPILRIENLTKCYESEFTLEIPYMEFQEGRIYSIVGPNGAGKTTFLSLLNLLEEPTKGEIFFEGQKIINSSRFHLNIRQKMHMIMENPLLFHTTVFKNIAFGLRIRSIDKKIWPQIVKEALEMVGLEGFEKKYAYSLSRGETQRIAIARALVLKPEVLFLDEPFTNIDRRNINVIEKLIKTINQKYGTTIIFTTHDLFQAYRLSDEVISLVDGKVVEGSLENLFSGRIEEADGLKWVRISPSVKVAVVTNKRGKVHISIPPQDIILSHSQFQSSALNSFKGMIKKIQLEDEIVRVSIEIEPGVELIALITKTSFDKMNLSVGSYIFLTFKTTSVMTF